MGTHARVYCSIWADRDFRALPPGAQRMYVFLASQEDLSMCGLLIVRERFWATSAAGLTPEEVHRDVGELHRARFVVVDEDTQELLVRSKVRRDQVLAGPKLLKPLARAADRIMSGTIRQVLAVELDRCLAEDLVNLAIADEVRSLASSLAKSAFPQVDTLSDTLLTRENKNGGVDRRSGPPLSDSVTQPEFPQVDTLSDRVSDRESDREADRARGVFKGDVLTEPPTDVLTEPLTDPPRAHARARTPKPGSDDDPAFAEFWAAYPRKTAKGAARTAWAKALKVGADPRTLITAASRFAASPGRNPDYTPHPATWLNQERWEDDPGHGTGQQPGNGSRPASAHRPYKNPHDQSVYDEGINR